MNTSDKKLVYVLIAFPIIAVAFFAGLYVGGDSQGGSLDARASVAGAAVKAGDDLDPFWKAWDILRDRHVDAASTTVQQNVWGSIEGLAASYGDPYTVFFPPRENKLFKEDIAGNFGGVGMEIGVKDGQLVVIAPLEGNPAKRAGVEAGDAIVSINGTSTMGMNTDEAVSLIRGPQGTDVKIGFLTKDSTTPIIRTITRATINIPVIDISTKPGGISVIKLHNFSANSADLFRNALREFAQSGNSKLILDLRRNPGGYLDASWDMASYFLPAGKVIVTEDFGKNGAPIAYRSKGYNVFNSSLKMMILVDGGSASASEILAGALKEHGIAKLVGTKTFGKGSVQELIPITHDTSLKVTIASWLTPLGHNLSKDGLEPDYKVEPTDKQLLAGEDPIMDKAVELLRSGL